MTVRRKIETVLPQHVLRAIVEIRNAIRLAALPRGSFDPADLRPRTQILLERIFSDPSIAESWEADHEAIRAVYGDGNLDGGINPGDRRALYSLIAGLRCGRVLEIGTHIGASTLYIARALMSGGREGRVTTVDIVDVNDPVRGPWKGVGLERSPGRFASELHCAECIHFVARPSLDFMSSTPERYDLVFLDGDHSAHVVYREVSAALGILGPGGVILLHDYYPEGRALFPDGRVITGPFRALERVRRECPAVDVLPLGELPWSTKQGVNATSLALVVRS